LYSGAMSARSGTSCALLDKAIDNVSNAVIEKAVYRFDAGREEGVMACANSCARDNAFRPLVNTGINCVGSCLIATIHAVIKTTMRSRLVEFGIMIPQFKKCAGRYAFNECYLRSACG